MYEILREFDGCGNSYLSSLYKNTKSNSSTPQKMFDSAVRQIARFKLRGWGRGDSSSFVAAGGIAPELMKESVYKF
jgi:hypothetical protein